MNRKYNSALIVGSILSISSFFGIFFNLFTTKFFRKKTYHFFTTRMILFALITTLILILSPKSIWVFVIAMITWSTYYELRNYAKYDFVERFQPPRKNAESWSVLTTFQSLAYMLGPALALVLIRRGVTSVLAGSLIAISLTSICFLIFQKVFGKDSGDREGKSDIEGLFSEVKLIHILAKRVWPLVLFTFALTLLDVSMWSVGILYSEQLRLQNEIGGLFITTYGLPAILVGIITPKIYSKFGKKRTAFLFGIAAGFLLLLLGIVKNTYLILMIVFIMATCSGISFILVYATFEDFVTRLDGKGNSMVSILQITQNFAYAFGPIFFGLISQDNNFSSSFIAGGEILILFSILALLTIPRKIKMPHKEIAEKITRKIEDIGKDISENLEKI